MISIYLENFKNEITQKIYDTIISVLNIHALVCPMCGHCHMTKHAYYSRKVKTTDGIKELVILRVKCENCNSTHALLPSCLIPYQSIQLKDQVVIVKNEKLDELLNVNVYINHDDIKRVRRNYRKHYKEMLEAHGILLDDDLVIKCFKVFKRTFNQIKRGYILLYTQNHITNTLDGTLDYLSYS